MCKVAITRIERSLPPQKTPSAVKHNDKDIVYRDDFVLTACLSVHISYRTHPKAQISLADTGTGELERRKKTKQNNTRSLALGTFRTDMDTCKSTVTEKRTVV